jgi:hypothetical protein
MVRLIVVLLCSARADAFRFLAGRFATSTQLTTVVSRTHPKMFPNSLDTESNTGDACALLPYPPYPGVAPGLIFGEVELAEMEDSQETRTQLFLDGDGTVKSGATNGPPPVAMCGLWQCGSIGFQMVLQRTFTASRGTRYTVTRVYTGAVNADSKGVDAVLGRMGFYPTDEELAGLSIFGDNGLGGATAIGYFSIDGNTQAELQRKNA